jgi:hypothetical protein
MIKQIKDAAQCLLGISDDWKYSDIEEHLEWLLENRDEIAEGYPMDVMYEEYFDDIMLEVNRIISYKVFD